MVKIRVEYTNSFKKQFSKIKNKDFKQKILKQVEKIIENPEIGKPMRNVRKGTREVYINSFRLAYSYIENELLIIFLEIYHKDEQ